MPVLFEYDVVGIVISNMLEWFNRFFVMVFGIILVWFIVFFRYDFQYVVIKESGTRQSGAPKPVHLAINHKNLILNSDRLSEIFEFRVSICCRNNVTFVGLPCVE